MNFFLRRWFGFPVPARTDLESCSPYMIRVSFLSSGDSAERSFPISTSAPARLLVGNETGFKTLYLLSRHSFEGVVLFGKNCRPPPWPLCGGLFSGRSARPLTTDPGRRSNIAACSTRHELSATSLGYPEQDEKGGKVRKWLIAATSFELSTS